MTQLKPGHTVDLLQSGQEYFAALMQAFDQAQREVWLETYIFNLDQSGIAVAEALERAAARGVKVYLTMDGIGTPTLPPEWRERFERSGVHWSIFLPLGRIGVFIPSRWRRLHRKLCVVDGNVAFCGGINVLDDLFDPNHGKLTEPRLDFAVRVCGPLVGDVLEAMTHFWWRQQLSHEFDAHDFPAAWRSQQLLLRRAARAMLGRGRDARGVPASAIQNTLGTARAGLLLRDNLRNRRKIEAAYLQAFSAAQSEIFVANAYFLPGARLRRALINAARRGVRVRLLLQGRYEYFLQYHASRPVYGALLDAGVEIHEYAASFLHAKVAVVDSLWATVGSSNLDPLSLLMSREANVMVLDEAFAVALKASLERAMAHGGKQLDARLFGERSWLQRVKERVAYSIMRFGLLLLGRRY